MNVQRSAAPPGINRAMQARVARYRIAPDRCGDAVDQFLAAGEGISRLEGFCDGYVLIDPDAGEVVTVTLWESHVALAASEVRAAGVRQAAARSVGGEIESVRRYDVAHRFGSDESRR